MKTKLAAGIGISPGGSWQTCVEVSIPPDYSAPRHVGWALSGNATPTPSIESGHSEIEKCTPLTLTPSRHMISGCSGTVQTLDFSLDNYGAGNNTNVTLTYDVPGAELSGPAEFMISEGSTSTFSTELTPQLCVAPGEQIIAKLTVNGNGHTDSATISETTSANAGWHTPDDSPNRTMDIVRVRRSWSCSPIPSSRTRSKCLTLPPTTGTGDRPWFYSRGLHWPLGF